MTLSINRLRQVLLSAVVSFLPALVSAQDTAFDGATFFGDSLTDPGNKYALTGLRNTPPYDQLDEFLIPDGPYATGGLHHSNGQTWAEQFAKPLGWGGYARPAYRGRGKAANYAYGGARAAVNPLVIPPCTESSSNQHLNDQIETFLLGANGDASADTLYAIFIGGNDVVELCVVAFIVELGLEDFREPVV